MYEISEPVVLNYQMAMSIDVASLFCSAENEFKKIFEVLSMDKRTDRKWCEGVMNSVNSIKEVLVVFKDSLMEIHASANVQKTTHPHSYAQAVSTPSTKTRNVVIVSPRTPDIVKDSEQTLKIIKETTVNKIQVGINSVKKVRNKSVVIELRSKEECEAFMKKVETNSQHLTARIPTKRNPEVIIHGIEAGIGNDDLIQCIVDQNPYIKHCLDSGEQMEIRFMKRSRDNTTQFAVLRVTPTIYHAMRNGGKVYIGYSRCPVKDHIPVTRCYTCCGYGHISKDCTFERHCRRCAEDHSFDICPQEKTVCINCLKFNTKMSSRKNPEMCATNHDATDTNCPAYKKIVEIITSKINYG